jgi:predicted Zn-dependent peptidase
MNHRQIETTRLPNGLRVVSEKMPHLRSVSVGMWIGTGARWESPQENGISHFIEHMLFKGTEKRSAEEIARVVDSTGGNLDAYTAKELVSFSSKVIDEHLPIAFDVLADMLIAPSFRDDDIEKEKGVILEELKMDVDNPEYLVHETFSSKFWKNHSLGRPILGTKATITSFDRAIVAGYHGRVYNPANILITAAGNLDHQQLVDLAGSYFGSLPEGQPPAPDALPKTQPPLILKRKKSLEQVHVCMGLPCYPIDHERRYPLYVLNTILGGGMSSRLFQKIREQNGLAYSIYSELSLYRDAGCLYVYGGTSEANAGRVVQMTVDELRALAGEPVPAEEVKRAKDHLKGSIALSLESSSSRMSNLARQELFFGRFFTIDEMVEAIEQVTAEDVQLVARELFEGRQVGLTLLGRVDGINFQPEQLVC